MRIDFSKTWVQWTTMIFLSLIWGSSFILMKRGLVSFSPVEVAAYRIFIVFAVLFPFSFKHLTLLKGKTGLALLGVGLLGSALPYFLFILAQTQITSSLNGILNSLTPLFTLLFASLIFRQKFKLRSILGVFFGFIGALGLIYFSSETPSFGTFSVYVFLPILASAFYGINVNIIKMYLQNISPMTITSLAFVIIGPLSGLYLFTATDFVHNIVHAPEGWASLGYISILGIIGTALAVWVFNMMVKETSALFASSVTYLIPIVAIIWGVLDNEMITLFQLVFTGVIFLGISLINNKSKPKIES